MSGTLSLVRAVVKRHYSVDGTVAHMGKRRSSANTVIKQVTLLSSTLALLV